MSTRYVNAILVAVLMAIISLNGIVNFSEYEETNHSKLDLVEPSDAPTNPGHTVFAQYITSDNCGYCYAY